MRAADFPVTTRAPLWSPEAAIRFARMTLRGRALRRTLRSNVIASEAISMCR
jgi:hypothetical protein